MKKPAAIREAKKAVPLIKILMTDGKPLQLSLEVATTKDDVVLKLWTKLKQDYEKLRAVME